MKIICFFVVCSFVILAAQEYPVFEIEDGPIQGISQRTNTGKLFYAFKEIPYAKPPIGDLRFTEPVPPEKWKYVRDATKNTKICVQKKPAYEEQIYDPRENEDCLYLNIFTPYVSDHKDTDLLPVYVYIFGGMFIAGDPTEYNFQGLLNEDIVVVTINFRLSTLGCLSTSDGVIPSNLWMKDQILALKWVQRNIDRFGGDPQKVTLGGHSSGASSVSMHILNTKTKGLFRAAILQSGAALFPGYNLHTNETAYKFAENFDPNIRSKDTNELLQLLRKIPAKVITRTNFKERPWFLQNALMGKYRPPWSPVLEDENSENPIISGPPHYKFENGIFNRVPIMMGITDEEGLTAGKFLKVGPLDKNFSNILDPNVDVSIKNWTKAALEIKDMYTQTKLFKENMTGFIQLVSDLIFSDPIIMQAYLQSQFADVYFYEFSYIGPTNGLSEWQQNPFYQFKGLGSAGHCAELPLLYYYRLDPKVVPTKDDLIMRKRLMKLWTNFIKYLNPTPTKEELLEYISWEKMSKSNFQYLNIAKNMSIKTNPKRFVEWNNKIEKYFEQPQYFY